MIWADVVLFLSLIRVLFALSYRRHPTADVDRDPGDGGPGGSGPGGRGTAPGEGTRQRDLGIWRKLEEKLSHSHDETSALEALRFREGDSSPRACLLAADVQRDTIIRTNASREAGAVFLVTVDVDGQLDCIARCCALDKCNLAVVDAKHETAKCFLFDCKHPSVCQFTTHAGYSSTSLPRGEEPPVDQDDSAPPSAPPTATTPPPTTRAKSSHEADLDSWGAFLTSRQGDARATSTTISPAILSDVIKMLNTETARQGPRPGSRPGLSSTSLTTTSPVTTTDDITTLRPSGEGREVTCRPEYEIVCASGSSCVALNDVCDGFDQCDDGSDENPDICRVVQEAGGVGEKVGDASPTTLAPVATTRPRIRLPPLKMAPPEPKASTPPPPQSRTDGVTRWPPTTSSSPRNAPPGRGTPPHRERDPIPGRGSTPDRGRTPTHHLPRRPGGHWAG